MLAIGLNKQPTTLKQKSSTIVVVLFYTPEYEVTTLKV